ncbi:hypothetical protein Pint_35659 [Pistacia integerrima]|uniref:Uncharacterized protein n=1 Tax=Pistacia integerrima TaxID=434235 RepID=A0ACC0Y5D0_9ROSI|nr:hypothetical protein Pint_35659 [Pistacia integerrima]
MKRFHFGNRDKRDKPIFPRTLESLVSMSSLCSIATDDGVEPNTHNVSIIDTDSTGRPLIPMSEKPSNVQGLIKNSEDPSQRVEVAVKQLEALKVRTD